MFLKCVCIFFVFLSFFVIFYYQYYFYFLFYFIFFFIIIILMGSRPILLFSSNLAQGQAQSRPNSSSQPAVTRPGQNDAQAQQHQAGQPCFPLLATRVLLPLRQAVSSPFLRSRMAPTACFLLASDWSTLAWLFLQPYVRPSYQLFMPHVVA